VVITADHGEEFNDNGLGYWGHASNFSIYQTHVPMIVAWPKQGLRYFNYQTTHYDVVPFFMQNALGCKSPATTYSVGTSLVTTQQAPFFIINSYIDYGIVTPNEVTRIYPQGNIGIKTRTGKSLPNAKPDVHLIQQSMEQLNYFFKSH
ncbi:MAG TPA: sulfatase-like hydrolase/transferase, partial [Flavobacteriales bacterium]|nr:sulfatase-like hydrolase/transferase [Flavobacteriales bacterium]